MSKRAQQEQQGAEGADAGAPKKDNVVDADYEVVDEDKTKVNLNRLYGKVKARIFALWLSLCKRVIKRLG